MKLTKLGHACVRLEKDDRVIVIDPGIFSQETDALDGVDAVLITHEHDDHLDAERVGRAMAGNPELRVYANAAVAESYPELAIERIGAGDRFTAAGFDVRVHGEWHAAGHPDDDIAANCGFLVDGEVFHPGDSLTVPEDRVSTLLLPCDAPWLKGAEMVAYLREIAPPRAYAIHDAYVSQIGMERIVGGWLEYEAERAGADIRPLKPGETVDL
ncbi:MBL fold metallo-hydrolase [Fodinicola acaciae]|uniref:MBL fold metallo-hydrolase n=1 Tax=Fodinicola acaciae TaxID=2681555 RepID=UPI0013D05C26|nr:MBL fold metallo-hydrolase [Fodinicola acaciae]